MGVRTANVKDGNIGETLEGLAAVIHQRAVSASPEESYTARLLQPEKGDKLLSKLAEESSEIIMALQGRGPWSHSLRDGRPSLPHARGCREVRHHARRTGRRA